MNKRAFLEALAAQLESLSEAERERSLAFYAEMIDDRVEGGATEEEAVATLGPVEEIAAEILGSAPVAIGVQYRKRRKLRGWEIALLAIGSPVWLPLLAAAAVVALALLIVIWALVVSLWAAAASAVLSVPMSIVTNVTALFQGNMLRVAASISTACVAAGLAILLWFAGMRVTRGAARLTRTCWRKMRGIR